MINFELIPADLRVPGVFAEFDASKAISGLPGIPYRILAIGQKLAAGTAAAEQLVQVDSADDAKTLFGDGSLLQHMIERIKGNNQVTPVWALPLDDDGAGVAATGSVQFTGTATGAGTIYLYIAGRRLTVVVASGDTGTVIAAAVVAAINADTSLPVTAAVNGVDDTQADLSARHKGEVGNELDVRLNYNQGEALPAGITVAVTAMSGGTTNPTLTTALAALGDEWFQVWAVPYTDTTSLTAIETELAARWGPLQAIEGQAFAAKNDTVANLTTFGNGRNSKHSTVIGLKGSPTPAYELASAVAGVVGEHGQRDPARPFQTLRLVGVLAPKESDRFTLTERNALLGDGIATVTADAAGAVRVERLVTTYQTNDAGSPDASFRDVNTLRTLGYIRFQLRTRFATRYPRHKLAADGTRVGIGQPVLTPKVAKAEVISLFRDLEAAGIVEDLESFKKRLDVQRNKDDTNRLDMIVPPDLINQLRVVAAKVQFTL